MLVSLGWCLLWVTALIGIEQRVNVTPNVSIALYILLSCSFVWTNLVIKVRRRTFWYWSHTSRVPMLILNVLIEHCSSYGGIRRGPVVVSTRFDKPLLHICCDETLVEMHDKIVCKYLPGIAGHPTCSSLSRCCWPFLLTFDFVQGRVLVIGRHGCTNSAELQSMGVHIRWIIWLFVQRGREQGSGAL